MRSICPKRQTVVITGVTRGIGRAMAAELVRLGHLVLGCARTQSEIYELRELYPEQDFQNVDVASDVQVGAWADRLLSTFGPPDFVLNNAAVINLKASVWEIGDRDFSDTVDINIKGVVNVVRHFTPSMIGRRRGVIVNFSSRWGKHVEEQMAAYCASKWAVVALTKVLARELRPKGIAAVELNPGIVRTGMLQRYLGNTDSVDALLYPSPAHWAATAVPFILGLSLKDTGKLRHVPISGTNPRFTEVA
jgi:NAD(P)-dependent dehydrogenase (short-subunit alcohol dehydrogenase family)